MIFSCTNDFVRYICATKSKQITGITSGVFDLLHPLHVEYLNKARRGCDELFVMIDSDRLVNENKKKTPLINELDRAFMVDNLKSVSGVLVFDKIEEMYVVFPGIQLNKPADLTVRVYKNGGQIYGKSLITYGNIDNIIIPDIVRFQSTTEIVNHLNKGE